MVSFRKDKFAKLGSYTLDLGGRLPDRLCQCPARLGPAYLLQSFDSVRPHPTSDLCVLNNAEERGHSPRVAQCAKRLNGRHIEACPLVAPEVQRIRDGLNRPAVTELAEGLDRFFAQANIRGATESSDELFNGADIPQLSEPSRRPRRCHHVPVPILKRIEQWLEATRVSRFHKSIHKHRRVVAILTITRLPGTKERFKSSRIAKPRQLIGCIPPVSLIRILQSLNEPMEFELAQFVRRYQQSQSRSRRLNHVPFIILQGAHKGFHRATISQLPEHHGSSRSGIFIITSPIQQSGYKKIHALRWIDGNKSV